MIFLFVKRDPKDGISPMCALTPRVDGDGELWARPLRGVPVAKCIATVAEVAWQLKILRFRLHGFKVLDIHFHDVIAYSHGNMGVRGHGKAAGSSGNGG